MIDLYSWPTPNGHKVHIMLEELEMPYNVIPVDIGKGAQFEPEFLKISPNNKIPVLVDPDGPDGGPITVFETGAMLIYLGHKTGRFIPPSGSAARFEAVQWLMFQMGGIGPMCGQQNHFNNYAPNLTDESQLAYSQARYNNEVARLYNVMDSRLGETAYLGGAEYGIADIATFPWVRNHERRRVDIDAIPNVKRWLDEIEARPAVQKGMKVLADVSTEGKGPSKEALENMFGATQYERR